MSRKRRSSEPNALDIETFKAWLSGVEDMQGADWTPSPEQWKKIRAKIDQITVPEEEVVVAQQPIYQQPGFGAFPPGVRAIASPATHETMQSPPAFVNGGSLPPVGNFREGPQLGSGGSLPAFQAPGAGNNNPQLSDAPYESSFS